MSPTFTTDDVGKTVESADGESLGVVVSVEPETAYVEPNPGVTDSIKAVLDWGSESEGAVPLADDAVDRVTEEAIRLEAAFPEESITSEEPREGGRSGDRQTSRRADDYTPGEPVSGTNTESEVGIDGTEEGPGSTARDDSEPVIDDEFYDDVETEPRTDPDEQMDETEPELPADGDDLHPDELDAVEEEASRGLEVDPTELTDRGTDAEIDPDEDVGQRTDAEVEPEMDMEERSDADVAPGNMDEPRRDDAAVDPDRVDSEVDAGAGVDEEEGLDDLDERERVDERDRSAEGEREEDESR